jgi:hypothetical protein
MDGRTRPADVELAVPALGALKIAPAAFGAGGATVGYTDSRRALTTFTLRRRFGSRWVTVGRFSHRDARGTNRLHWNGRLQGRQLRHGRYLLLVTPRAGRSTGARLRVRFTMVS